MAQQFSNCEELWRDLKKFVKTGDFTLGKELHKFERKFAKLIGTKYAVGVNSGTDAIKLSLKVIGIKPGDEVITTANTFVASFIGSPTINLFELEKDGDSLKFKDFDLRIDASRLPE